MQPDVERPYGVWYWKQAFEAGLEALIEEATHQPERNVRYALPGYRPGTWTIEAMGEAPAAVVAAVQRMVEAGMIDDGWANTVRLKSYAERSPSQAYDWHRDPKFYLTGGHLLLLTLTSAAWLDVRTPAGMEESFLCEAGTVIKLQAALLHRVSRPLDQRTRYVLFVGHDETMFRKGG